MRLNFRRPADMQVRSAEGDAPSVFINGAPSSTFGNWRGWDREKATSTHDTEPLVGAITTHLAETIGDTATYPVRARHLGGSNAGQDDEAYWMLQQLNVRATPEWPASLLRYVLSLEIDYSGEAWMRVEGKRIVPLIGHDITLRTTTPGQTYPDGSPRQIGAAEVRRNGVLIETVNPWPGPLARAHIPHPGNHLRADSPVLRAGLPIDVVHRYRLATRSVLINDGMPSFVAQVDQQISQDEVNAMSAAWNSKSTDVSRKGRGMFIRGLTGIQMLNQSLAGKDWTSIPDHELEDILSVWGMSPAALGRVGGLTYENQDVATAHDRTHVYVPRLQRIIDALNVHAHRDGMELYLDTSKLLSHRERTARADEADNLWTLGVIDLAERRERAGLEVRPGDEGVYYQQGPAPTAPAQPEGRAASPHPVAATRAAGTSEWETWLDASIPKVERVMARHIERMMKRATSALGRRSRAEGEQLPPSLSAEGIAGDVEQWDTELIADLRPVMETAAKGAADDAAEVVAQLLDTDVLVDQSWQQTLTERMVELIDGEVVGGSSGTRMRGINQQLLLDLQGALDQAYETGIDVDEAAELIRSRLGMDGARARTIAQTEVVGLGNQVRMGQWAASGGVTHWRWVTSGGKTVRPSHSDVGGRTATTPVVLGARVAVGSALMLHPGDRAGGAEETVNCNCVAVPVADGTD